MAVVVERRNPARIARYATYGIPDRQDFKRVYDNISTFASRLGERGRGLIDRAKQIFDIATEEDLISEAKDALEVIDSRYKGLCYYMDDSNYHYVQPETMKVIMAHPELQKMRDKGIIDGYRDYIDIPDEFREEDNPIIELANSGIVKEDASVSFYAHSHYDIDSSDAEMLRETWRYLLTRLSDEDIDFDPTNV